MTLLPEYYFTKLYSDAYRSNHWTIYQPNHAYLSQVSTRISAKALVAELNYLHHQLRRVQKELDDLKAYYALQPTLFHQIQINSQGKD